MEAATGALPSSAYPSSAMTWHVNAGYTHSYILTCALPCVAGQGHALASLCRASHPKALPSAWPLLATWSDPLVIAALDSDNLSTNHKSDEAT